MERGEDLSRRTGTEGGGGGKGRWLGLNMMHTVEKVQVSMHNTKLNGSRSIQYGTHAGVSECAPVQAWGGQPVQYYR